MLSAKHYSVVVILNLPTPVHIAVVQKPIFQLIERRNSDVYYDDVEIKQAFKSHFLRKNDFPNSSSGPALSK